MRKIGLITLWKRNYGSALQCYATKTVLQKMGYNCFLFSLQYTEFGKIKQYLKNLLLYVVYGIRFRCFLRKMQILRKASRYSINSLSDESKIALDVFCFSELQPRLVSYRMLTEIAKREDYVAFVCGSDQIWNGSMLYDKTSFLRFCPSQKRIALAASFGSENIENYNKKKFKKAIAEIPYVSVREDTGRKIVKNLTGRDVPQIPDPSFLLSPREWKTFSEGGLVPKEKYVLLHFIDKPSKVALQHAFKLAQKYNLTVYGFAYPHKEYDDGNVYFLNGSPKDYVSLIFHAEYVLTDSFHTTLFSLYGLKDFYTYERKYRHNSSQESRKIDLLKQFACESRYCSENNVVPDENKLPNEYILKIIDKERNKCYSYISQTISKIDLPEKKELGIRLNLERCCGCRLCEQICPKNAISFRTNDYGYGVPEIDPQQCVRCGRCVSICEKSIEKRIGLGQAYLGASLDHDLEQKSASGGAFSAIAKNVLLRGGCVYGAKLSFDEGKPVLEHVRVCSVQELPSILKSKYIQSDCFNSYQLIKRDLQDGKIVLFGGTSCQVDALYRFLGKNIPENLITTDVVCHGVPGIALFKEYCSFISQKFNKKIIDFSFRTKKQVAEFGKNSIVYEETITFEDGCVITIPWLKSPYFRMFLACESYRESCYQCKFSNTHKPADITLGDYFEAYHDYAQLIKENESILKKCCGLSCIIPNSAKGINILSSVENIFMLKVDENMAKYHHLQLCMPSMYTEMRKKLFKIYHKKGFRGVSRFFRRRNMLFFIPKKMMSLIKNFR